MIEEFHLQERRVQNIGRVGEDATEKAMVQVEVARILTGYDAMRYTGRREPVLTIGNYTMTRTTLLETLIKMGQLELKDPR